MTYKTQGKVIHKGEFQSGTGKNGNEWKKTSVAIDTEEKYNNIISFSAFGELVPHVQSLKIGDEITVEFNVSSREYQGKYYTEAAMKDFTMDQPKDTRASNEGTRHAPAPQDEFDNLPF